MTKRWCENEGCESPAMETVETSINKAGDSKRHYCYPCYCAYMVGMQHKSFTEAMPRMALLAELINDVESVGTKETMDDWPDLYETYRKAMRLLHNGKLRNQFVETPEGKATHFRERCTGCGYERYFTAEDA